MSSTKKRQLIFLQLLAVLFISAVSCNSKEEIDNTEIAVTPGLVAISKFYLRSNDSVMKNLDSVFFSIDLNTGVIFNADSLPKGTKVSRLVASITFANTMTKAEITYLRDNQTDSTINYLTNPDDSIDFTHPVTLNVTAQDGVSEFTYKIKVNVHNQESDTLVWDKLATSELPSMYAKPVAQKTLLKDHTTFTLVEEYNGEYTLSTCADLNEGVWEKHSLPLSFVPEVKSFSASATQFWLLADSGELYTSADGLDWVSTNKIWKSVIGVYGETLFGIRETDDNFIFTQYPDNSGFTETELPVGFPVSGFSPLGVVDTEWADSPFALLVGGITAEGELSDNVWGFDGENWSVINETVIPALDQPMMARYVVFRDTPYISLKRQLDVWLLFGGETDENQLNREVYMTYDNGVHWSLAPETMQLPESFPLLKGSDIIVEGYELSADLSNSWILQETDNTRSTRASYTIDGYDITWICPYLYIFGGYSLDNELSTTLWRGVINRLTFTPII